MDYRVGLNAIVDIASVLALLWAIPRVATWLIRVVFCIFLLLMCYYAIVDVMAFCKFITPEVQMDALIIVATTLRAVPAMIAISLVRARRIYDSQRGG